MHALIIIVIRCCHQPYTLNDASLLKKLSNLSTVAVSVRYSNNIFLKNEHRVIHEMNVL